MHRTEIAAFLNQKGGVGKTTSVVNIGSGLTILAKKVLIVDLDPQGHLTRSLGIESNGFNKTIYDVLKGEISPREAIVGKKLGARLSVNGRESGLSLTVIPSRLDLADSAVGLSRLPGAEYLLKKVLDEVRHDYDYVLIDCPPSLGLLTTNALTAANKVFIPVQTEYLALESLDDLKRKIEWVISRFNPDLEIGGFIATRFDGRKVLNRTVVERLKERFGSLFLETMIRENIVLAEAPSFGKDIFTYRPRSYGAKDYLDLCLEIIDGNNTARALLAGEQAGASSGQRPEEGSVRREIAHGNPVD